MEDKDLIEILKYMLEHDVVVRMPPKRRRFIKVKVRSIKKATPCIIDPYREKGDKL